MYCSNVFGISVKYYGILSYGKKARKEVKWYSVRAVRLFQK